MSRDGVVSECETPSHLRQIIPLSYEHLIPFSVESLIIRISLLGRVFVLAGILGFIR